MKKSLFKGLFVGIGLLACNGADDGAWRSEANDPEFLHAAIKQVTDIIVHDIFSPPVSSRIYAYTSIAAYETAITGNPKYLSLAGQINDFGPVPPPEEGKEYCFSLASVQAALAVGKELIFSEDKLEAHYNSTMQRFKQMGIPGDVYQRSVDYGSAVAKHVLAYASRDNYKQSRSFPKYSVVDDPATWKPTPPAYMDGVEPHWNRIRTFVMDSATQFAPPPPTPFSTDKDSKFYAEAVEVFEIGKNLTDEQKEIASFWDCNPFMMNVKGHVMFATKKISPGGHWMNITRVACSLAGKDFIESAEAYVLVSLSLIEGFISCWDEKYRSKLVRPETYINQHIDENWTPLLQTPPFPEYTSGHSVISTAAAVALTSLFGDNFSFTDSTEIEFGLTARSFNSFQEASAEAAMSRMYGGIHYRPACEVGVVEGRAIGELVVERVRTRRKELTSAD